MLKAQLLARDRALEHVGHRAKARVGALGDALLAHLAGARAVARGDVCAARRLAHSAVLEDEVAKEARLAVVPVGAQPLLWRRAPPRCTDVCAWWGRTVARLRD